MEGQLSALTLAAPSERAITFVNTFSRDAHYPIFSCLCDHLSIGGILALSKTCKDFSDIYDYLLPMYWNMDKRLQRFVNDPTGLRSKMGELDVLISGSFAIQFFERVTWPSSGLDLYVEEGERSDALYAYLVDSEGYTLQTTRGFGDNDYALPHFYQNRSTEVYVIATSDIPIHAILNTFFTTLVVNIITWNKAYSIFPLTTFIQKRGYLLRLPDADFASLMVNYTQRGWTIQQSMRPEDPRANHPIRENRRIGDQFTWQIPLDVRKVKSSKTPDAVLEYSNFGFRISRYRHWDPFIEDGNFSYIIAAFLYPCDALRYKYTYSLTDWRAFMINEATRLTMLELRKLKPSQRPPHYDRLVYGKSSQFGHKSIEKPESWTYWDSEIPNWYYAWEKIYNDNKAIEAQ
ncbi:MAG: hypothetical protein Q9204_006697 [Flavoplaca sp. TL-2023a]